MADMFLTLALDDRADGRRWVLPHGQPATQREVQRLVADTAGASPKHGTYGPLMMWLGGRFDPDIREVTVVRAQWEHPWAVDGSAFEATFGTHTLTPLPDAIATTVAARRNTDPAAAAA